MVGGEARYSLEVIGEKSSNCKNRVLKVGDKSSGIVFQLGMHLWPLHALAFEDLLSELF